MSRRNDSKRLVWSVLLCAIAGASLDAGAARGEWLPDPTRPPAVALPDASKKTDAGSADKTLDLTAVLIADGRRLAIINGERVHENDTIDAARVIRIDPGRVHLERQGKLIEIELIRTRINEKSPAKSDVASEKGKTE